MTLKKFDFSHNMRKSDQISKMYLEFGLTLIEHIKHIPNGVVLFFCSHAVMKECRDLFVLTGIMRELDKIKPSFVEP
jgi:Rad3-related DNA helicase